MAGEAAAAMAAAMAAMAAQSEDKRKLCTTDHGGHIADRSSHMSITRHMPNVPSLDARLLTPRKPSRK